MSRVLYSSIRSSGLGLAAARQQQQAVGVGLRFFSAGGALDRKTIEERVLKTLTEFSKVKKDKLSLEKTFADFGLDSLDTVEVVMAIEEEFGVEIPDAEADKIQSPNDAVTYIASQPSAK